MDAASILLVLAAAGQAGWAPERSVSPPPASASTYDRYAQQPSTPAAGVSPPPSVVDRTRTAVTESGAALRDGVEAGIEAANQQIQEWSDGAGRQLQSTGNNLRAAAEESLGVSGKSAPRVSNPFGAMTSPPPATNNSRTRTGVAPPPWTGSSATTAPSWDAESTESGPAFGRNGSSGLERMPSDSGWTSIGSQVAAPPLLVPALTSSTSTTPGRDTAVSGVASDSAARSQRAPTGRLSGEPSRQAASSATGADSWATGWGDNASAPAATISRSSDNSTRNAASGMDSTSTQTANPRPQDSQQQTGSGWADLWGNQDPWSEPRQASRSSTPAAQAIANASAPVPNNSASPPLLAPPANNVSTIATAPSALPAATGAAASRDNAAPVAATDEPPWLPLLVVSLSLAGSLGANLYLAWSYFDARQKYRALVGKTADKFRRAAA